MDADEARRAMVLRLEEGGVVRDPRVAAALRAVPREEFAPPAARAFAFRDEPLPIGGGQTMSAPHMVAIMLEALDLRPGQRVLEVGGGSGYHAACIAALVRPAGRVVSVELVPSLAEESRRALRRTGFDDVVEVVEGDGSLGHAAKAPYDRISVAAAAPRAPPALVAEIAPSGILLLPLGDRGSQVLTRFRRTEDGRLLREELTPCRFVPLLGAGGFDRGSAW